MKWGWGRAFHSTEKCPFSIYFVPNNLNKNPILRVQMTCVTFFKNMCKLILNKPNNGYRRGTWMRVRRRRRGDLFFIGLVDAH
jgi:hypothetical protein